MTIQLKIVNSDLSLEITHFSMICNYDFIAFDLGDIWDRQGPSTLLLGSSQFFFVVRSVAQDDDVAQDDSPLRWMKYRNVTVPWPDCCNENVSNREGGWVTLAKRHNLCPLKIVTQVGRKQAACIGASSSKLLVFISCPIWRDLVLSILYRPCELGLFPFHTQCLRNPGHQRESPVCQTSPAPDVIFFALHRYSRCCIQSKVTFLGSKTGKGYD